MKRLAIIATTLAAIAPATVQGQKPPVPSAQDVLPCQSLTAETGSKFRCDLSSGGVSRLHLYGTDAPEMDQPHGPAARKALQALIKDHDVICRSVAPGLARCGYLVGKVHIDVGRRLVQEGAVWATRDSSVYMADMAKARAAYRGLFDDLYPINPADWRSGVRLTDEQQAIESAVQRAKQLTITRSGRGWYEQALCERHWPCVPAPF